MSPSRKPAFAPMDAHVEGRISVSASRFTPTNVLGDILDTDIQSCRSASSCGAVPESSTSSCSGIASTARTSVSTALPADSDSEDDARNVARPHTSMAVGSKPKGPRVFAPASALTRLQNQHRLKIQKRQAPALNDSRGPSPLPQLDLAGAVSFGAGLGPRQSPSPQPDFASPVSFEGELGRRQPQPKAKRLPRLG